jgi:hypothetical protein
MSGAASAQLEAQAPEPSFLHLGYGEPIRVEQFSPDRYLATFMHLGQGVHLVRVWCASEGRAPCWRWSPAEHERGA